MVVCRAIAAVSDDQTQNAPAGYIHRGRLCGRRPVITPLSNNFTPSAHTWKTTEPPAPASSSTPISEVKSVQALFRLNCSCGRAHVSHSLSRTSRRFRVKVPPSPPAFSPLLRSFSAGPTRSRQESVLGRSRTTWWGRPATHGGVAKSAWSLLSVPASVTVRSNRFFPVMLTLMDLATLAPVSTPLSYSFTPSPQTVKRDDPRGATSSSTPAWAVNSNKFRRRYIELWIPRERPSPSRRRFRVDGWKFHLHPLSHRCSY